MHKQRTSETHTPGIRHSASEGASALLILGRTVFRLASITPILAITSTANAQLTPASFETPEYYRSGGLQHIFASEAYALGFTGKGVKIGIADDAMQWSHPELVQRVYWPSPLYQFPAPGYSTYPDHGTHVAGIAAAQRNDDVMMGVAFDASIAAAMAINGVDGAKNPVGFPYDPNWAQSLINAGVSVMNGSFNYGPNPEAGPRVHFQFYQASWLNSDYEDSKKLADADVLMAFSTGNNYDRQPSASSIPYGNAALPLITPANTKAGYPFSDPLASTSALYRVFTDNANKEDVNTWVANQLPESAAITEDFSGLKGSMIAVTAVDIGSNGVSSLTDFANRCGAAADWCVAAPGVNIYSSIPINKYGPMDGTSMASPHVAGTAALVRQAFPYMTARQAIEVLLTTATPLTSFTASEVGHGLINAGRAVKGPIQFNRPSLIAGLDSMFSPIFAVDTKGFDSVWSNDISGTGGFSKAGEGILVLTGNNTYTGRTTVSGGLLRVDGSIVNSSLTVQSGGSVGGKGTLPTTVVRSGGVLAPGNSIGTLTVANLDINGGTINAEIQGPQNDLINVNGQVTNFTGTANLIPYAGGSPWPNFTYTIVSAPNSADFATSSSLTLDQSGVTSALLRSGTTLVQNVDGNSKTFDVLWQPKNGSGATASAMQVLGQGYRNQLATAGAVDRVFRSLTTNAANNANNTGSLIGNTGFTTGQAAASGISSGFLSATSQLLSLTSSSQLTAAINSLSPEPYAAFLSVGLDTLKRQRELLLSRAGNCPSTGWVVNAPRRKKGKQPKQPLCVFGQAANATSSIHGQNGLSSYDSGSFSTFYGVEYKPAKRWTIGAAYGYGSSYLNNMALTNALVSAGVNSGSLYGVYQPSASWTIRGMLGYSNFNASGSRNVAYIGNGLPITATPTANGYTAAINADYLIQVSTPTAKTAAYLKPLLGIAWGGYQQSSFTEASTGALNLNVDSNTANSLMGTVGLELFSSPIALNRAKTTAIIPRFAIAYQVDAFGNYTNVKTLTSSFAQAPAAGSFTTEGENRGVNTLSLNGGVEIQLASNASLYASVGYEAFSTGAQFTYGGGFRVKL